MDEFVPSYVGSLWEAFLHESLCDEVGDEVWRPISQVVGDDEYEVTFVDALDERGGCSRRCDEHDYEVPTE